MLCHLTLSSLILSVCVSQEIKLSGAFSSLSSQSGDFPTALGAVSILEYGTEVFYYAIKSTPRLDAGHCWTAKEAKNMKVRVLTGEKSISLQTPRRGWLYFDIVIILTCLLVFFWSISITFISIPQLMIKIINIPWNRGNGERICGSLRWSPELGPLDWDRFPLLSFKSVCHPRRKIFVTKQCWSLLLAIETQGTGAAFSQTSPSSPIG